MLALFAALLAGSVPYEAWFPGTSSIDEPEVIPPAYRGLWAPSAAACKAEYGVDVMAVKSGGIDFYEAGARLERVTQAGQERTIKLKLSYEGESDFWDRVETWRLSEDGSRLSITIDDKSAPLALVKCEL
jgi:hypothetical protein